MAFVAPPTFADGAVLSAADLNKLSDNQEYLKGILATPNVPFLVLRPAVVGQDADGEWAFPHLHDYFHWQFIPVAQGIDRMQIWIYASDGNMQFGGPIFDSNANPADLAAAITAGWTDSYDVSALPIGTWYRVVVNIDASTSGNAYLASMGEKETA